jgi:hypothetical protein
MMMTASDLMSYLLNSLAWFVAGSAVTTLYFIRRETRLLPDRGGRV